MPHTLGDIQQTEQWWLIKIEWSKVQRPNQEIKPIGPGEFWRSMWSEIPGPGWGRSRQDTKKQKDNFIYTDDPLPSNLLLSSTAQTTQHQTKKPAVSSRVALGENPRVLCSETSQGTGNCLSPCSPMVGWCWGKNSLRVWVPSRHAGVSASNVKASLTLSSSLSQRHEFFNFGVNLQAR